MLTAMLRRLSAGFGLKLPLIPLKAFDEIEHPPEESLSRPRYLKLYDVKQKYIRQPQYLALEHKGTVYHLYNAAWYPFGRMISEVAQHISGKRTPLFRNDRLNKGDVCVLVNIRDPLITGGRVRDKAIRYHTGWVGHLRTLSYAEVLRTRPRLLYEWALGKMLPKTQLSAKYITNLRTYEGPIHDLPFLPQFKPDVNDYLVTAIEQNKKRVAEELSLLENPHEPTFTSFDTPEIKTKSVSSQNELNKMRLRHAKVVKRYKKVSANRVKHKSEPLI